MLTVIAVAFAGSAGTVARFGVDQTANRMSPVLAPYATLGINVAGSLLLGMLAAGHLDGRARTALAVGFLGAFTTFSTLALQTYRAVGGGAYQHAFLLPTASVVAGVVAVYAGSVLGSRI
jgi:CrcB protein